LELILKNWWREKKTDEETNKQAKMAKTNGLTMATRTETEGEGEGQDNRTFGRQQKREARASFTGGTDLLTPAWTF